MANLRRNLRTKLKGTRASGRIRRKIGGSIKAETWLQPPEL
jgi:hypothetical protein